MTTGVVLALFDNPVFQSELLFLFIIIFAFAAIGLAGRSLVLGLWAAFMATGHVVQAVSSDVPELNTAFLVVVVLLTLYLVFRFARNAFGGGAGA